MNTLLEGPKTTRKHFSVRKQNPPPDIAPTETASFDVSGMTCAACQVRVQRSLEKEPGVTQASINLMLKSADVMYDPGSTTPEIVRQAITRTGYEVSIHTTENNDQDEQAQQEQKQAAEFRAFRNKAIVSRLLGLVAMVGDCMNDARSSFPFCLTVKILDTVMTQLGDPVGN